MPLFKNPFKSPFRAEPRFVHGQPAANAPRTAILWCNLGTPDAAQAGPVRRYLAEFLSDPRVIEIPKPVWWVILHGIILRFRPAKSAAKYASIWTEEGSPLRIWTQKQAAALHAKLTGLGHNVTVRYAMRYGQPNIASQLDALKAEGIQRILILPAYPQYSATSSASVMDAVYQWASTVRNLPEFRFVNRYHDDPSYIESVAQRVRNHWAKLGGLNADPTAPAILLMSFHGVPERTLHLGDPYHCECYKSARLIAEHLGLRPDQWRLSFQSRLGRAKWLEPYTEPTLIALAQGGLKRIDVVCPGFTSDCLETLEEIAMEGQHAFKTAGGQDFRYIQCVNDSAPFISALSSLAERHLSGWPTKGVLDAEALSASAERASKMGVQ